MPERSTTLGDTKTPDVDGYVVLLLNPIILTNGKLPALGF
jgi:hypothetical protein